MRIGEKYDFHGENFRRLLAFAVPKDATSPNFVEKTFTNSHKTAKFTKVFLPRKFSTIWYFQQSVEKALLCVLLS